MTYQKFSEELKEIRDYIDGKGLLFHPECGTGIRKLDRFNFYYACILPEYREEESVDIDLEDLPDLIIMLMEIGILDKELQKYMDKEREEWSL